MTPERTVVSIVLLGHFKPTEFELQRLSKERVISEEDVAATAYEMLVPEQAVILVLPWGKFSVVSDRLSVDITQVPYVRGADLVMKLLREISPGALVSKFGINLVVHYRFPDMEARDRFACKLVPPEGWGTFGDLVRKSFNEAGRRHGGLTRVTMRQAQPSDRSAGWLDVTVEPSALIANDRGVALSLNDHYELSIEDRERVKGSPRAVCEELLSLLEKNFDTSIERSYDICSDLTREFS